MAHAAPFHEPALHETEVAARVSGDILHPSVEFQYIPETEQVPPVGVESPEGKVHPSVLDHGTSLGLQVPADASMGVSSEHPFEALHATAESEHAPAEASTAGHPMAVFLVRATVILHVDAVADPFVFVGKVTALD